MSIYDNRDRKRLATSAEASPFEVLSDVLSIRFVQLDNQITAQSLDISELLKSLPTASTMPAELALVR